MEKREPKRAKPQKIYRELDEGRAKILYVILKLQDQYSGEIQSSGATQKRIAFYTKFKLPQVSRLLDELEEAGYIIRSQIYKGKGERIIYEVDALNSITFRDSAVIVLEMLDYECNDPEGKIETESFITHLLKSNKLRDFNNTDLLGNERYKGKIDLLADNGEHIELVTPRFIKPRLKAKLQRLYLELVVEGTPLDELAVKRLSSKKSKE